jgi:carbon monoxide dehydrogenase subunit G
MKVERAREIAAAPERVYRVVMDPSRLREWVTIHESLIDAPEEGLSRGSQLTQRLKLAGRRFNVHWTVVEDDRPTRVVWEGKGPVGSWARVIYELRPNESGTSFSYSNEYHLPGGALGRLAEPAVKRVTAKEIDATLERLKSLVERDPT